METPVRASNPMQGAQVVQTRNVKPWYNYIMAEQWITTAEAARLADYHPNHVRRLLKERRIEGRKFGPVWMVSRESLQAYLAEQRAKGERRGPKAD